MEDVLNRVVNFAWFERMDGKTVNHGALIGKWEKLWFGDIEREDIFDQVTSPGRNMNSMNTDALNLINRFYATFERDPGVVTMLSEPYTVPVGESCVCHDFVSLAIRRGNDHFIEYHTTKSAQSFMPTSERHHKTVLDAMAYQREYDVVPVIRIKYLKTGKVDDRIPSILEFRQIEELADEMAIADRFPTSGRNYWCDRCQFKSECHGWQ